MPTETTLNQVELTPEQTDTANKLLKWLSDNSVFDYEPILAEHLPPSEIAQAHRYISSALVKANMNAPQGVVVSGTGAAKAGAGVSGEDAQIAITYLKESGRLVQLGRGRGKLLVVISDKEIPKGSFRSEKAAAKAKTDKDTKDTKNKAIDNGSDGRGNRGSGHTLHKRAGGDATEHDFKAQIDELADEFRKILRAMSEEIVKLRTEVAGSKGSEKISW